MRIFSTVFGDTKDVNYKNEILAGLTVAIALVPEAIAFAFIAGLDPLVGLWAAVFMGFITAVFGGRPGMISGATGAIAVVVVDLVAGHGSAFLFAALIVAGFIQMAVGLLKLAKFIRLVPHPVMLGFVNGLAIVIFKAQFSQFKYKPEGWVKGDALLWMQGAELMTMIGLVILTMAIMVFLPKLTKVIPSALAAIVVVSGLVIGLNLQTTTVGDLASIAGSFPGLADFSNIELSMTTFLIILPFALKIAGVGLIESLLTIQLIDEMTETRGSGNRESIAQGLANMLSGMFGGMGGCAMIGQSMININSGSRKRLAGIIASLALMMFILVLSSVIEKIPVAALVGVMFMVAIGTFEWASLRILNKIPKVDMMVILIVTAVTVVEDLAVAVIVGVIVSAIAFAWENAVRIRARKYIDEEGIKHYEIYGPLFFGSVTAFNDKFDVHNDPPQVNVDFLDSRIADQSGLEAIRKLHEKYEFAGKHITFQHLSPECKLLLDNANMDINVNEDEDPRYTIAYT